MKKGIKYFLNVVDAIWQVPFAVALMIGMIILFMKLFGPGIDVYQPTNILAVFLSWAMLSLIVNFSRMILYFNLRGLHNYIFGNAIKEDWKTITPWQKFIISFSVFFFFILAALVLTLVMI